MPKVSVIIPTYNRERFLPSAIKSVLKQTFTDFEVIVSDDKSTDHTKQIVRSFRDERVKYILNEGNKGVSAARNSAILASKGDYIAFLDDDDQWLPVKLQKQVEVLDNSRPNICGVYANRVFIEKATGKILSDNPGTKKLRGNLLHQLMIRCPINTPTVVLKRRCLDKIGLFDETISYMEDRDLWIRLSLHWDFEYISESLARIYVHGQSHLSQNLEAQTAAKEVILEKYKHLFKKHKRSCATLYLCLGAQYCQLKEMKKGRKYIVKGIINHPFNKIAYFHFFSSLLGKNNYQHVRNFYLSALKMHNPMKADYQIKGRQESTSFRAEC